MPGAPPISNTFPISPLCASDLRIKRARSARALRFGMIRVGRCCAFEGILKAVTYGFWLRADFAEADARLANLTASAAASAARLVADAASADACSDEASA